MIETQTILRPAPPPATRAWRHPPLPRGHSPLMRRLAAARRAVVGVFTRRPEEACC